MRMNDRRLRLRALRIRFDVKAATLSGVVAAIVATGVELLLWRACAFALPETLFRDARLAAAIVLGREALSPPATFDWRIIAAATCVHFSLSIVYAFVLAAAIDRVAIRAATAAGALFGVMLYTINMYGFTSLFPWFAITRDPITLIAHVAFGITLSATYVATRKRTVA